MADLDDVLRRELAPVTAPQGLWAAIHRTREAPVRGAAFGWAFWPAAAVMLMLALAGVLRSYTISDMQHRAPVNVSGAGAPNCHTPAYAGRYIIAVSTGRNSQEGCLACHFSMPGMLMIGRP
jgi:hypothetical protein